MPHVGHEIDWLNEIIIPAINCFYTEDGDLISRASEHSSEYGLSERTIVANIYCKMNCLLKAKLEQSKYEPLEHLSIDVEYNREFTEPKRMYGECGSHDECRGCFIIEKKYIECIDSDGCSKHNKCDKRDECSQCRIKAKIPDLLIHHRGENDDNQVVIEFKKTCNKDSVGRDNDKAKLTYLTCPKSRYWYRYGYFIDLGKDKREITPYENAQAQKKI